MIEKVKKRIVQVKNLITNFGVVYTVKYIFLQVMHRDIELVMLMQGKAEQILAPVLERYNKKAIAENGAGGGKALYYIWICWWQGEENMPKSVRVCYESVKSQAPAGAKVRLITLENYMEYAEIPERIVRLFEKEKITKAFFSDVLRSVLLSKHGGWWIDATFYVTDQLFFDVNTKNWWSIRLDKGECGRIENQSAYITEGKWCGGLQWGIPHNMVNEFLMEAYDEYFKKHDTIMNYFFQDLFIRIAYENIPEIKEEIDLISESNPDLYNIGKYWNQKYCEQVWSDLKKETHLFRMSYKASIQELSEKGEKTYAGKLFEEIGE